MAMFGHQASRRHTGFSRRLFIEPLEDRRLLAVVTLNPNIEYQTIQGWGTAAVYPTNLVTVAQAGAIMRDAGMNVVRVTPGANDYTYTVGGNMTTPVPISANLDENVARFYPGGNNQTDLINWLQVNGLEPDRIMMIGALWSPPHWLKITTGRLMEWDDNGTPRSEYDPIIPWGDYGDNTGGGRVNPEMWTEWARYVLSTIKKFEQETGLPMYAFSFQNEPNVPAIYNSATFPYIANDVNNPSAGFTDGHWELYGDALEALANERALHPEITTKFFGPELSQLGGGASNPYNLPSYNAVRQNLISRGLLDDLGAWATHEYTYPADSAAMWDAWYSGSAHAAQIINGTNNLGWLGPTPGIAGDNKEIWQTETDGEDQTWTKDGAMGFGLKIQNALVFGNVSGYTSWTLTGYSSSDTWGLVDLDDINNPTNSYKYDAMKQFSRYVGSGAERIDAVFENGKATIGGAHALDSYNGLTVSAFNHAEDQRLTMVFTNMKTSSESTTITIPAGMNVSSFQVYRTSGTEKYVQLADLTPSGGQITLTIPASSFVTITGLYGTPSSVAPNAPTGLSGAVVTNRRIDLSWTDNASNETSYFLQRATNSSFTQNLAVTTLSSNATSYQDTTVVPSTTYYYRIRAYNSAGYSAYSNVVTRTTTAAAPPAAPTGLNGTVVSSSRIDLSWTDNASNETSFYYRSRHQQQLHAEPGDQQRGQQHDQLSGHRSVGQHHILLPCPRLQPRRLLRIHQRRQLHHIGQHQHFHGQSGYRLVPSPLARDSDKAAVPTPSLAAAATSGVPPTSSSSSTRALPATARSSPASTAWRTPMSAAKAGVMFRNLGLPPAAYAFAGHHRPATVRVPIPLQYQRHTAPTTTSAAIPPRTGCG